MRRLPLALAPLLALSSPASARIDDSVFSSLAFRQHPGTQLPLATPLIDEAGKPVRLGEMIAGRPTLLVLEYLRCRNLCSLVLGGTISSLKQAQLAPGRDFNLVAISIDPRDTTADAAMAEARYAQPFGNSASTGSGFHFLTGSSADVARIAGAVGFPYRFDRPSDQYLHPAGFVVLTPAGRISRYILGINPDPKELASAIAEASEGSVEPAQHPLLLLCFGYDPDEGTAAALAMRLVRWATAAVVLGSVALIAFLSLRRRTV